MSARASMSGDASTCSGAMYAGVPSGIAVRDAAPASSARATPKSVMTTRSFPRSTLSGFRSRWITPAACAASSPAQIAATISTAAASGSGPSRAMRVASESPSMSSIVKKRSPSCSPMIERARDVRVRHAARELHLATKALGDSRRVRDLALQHLQRDDLVELAIQNLVDCTHSADAEQTQNLVAVADDLRRAGERWCRVVRRVHHRRNSVAQRRSRRRRQSLGAERTVLSP